MLSCYLLSSYWLFPADVSVYSVTKGMRYVQTNDTAPVFLPFDEYLFQANVFSLQSNVIRSAFVEGTNHVDLILEQQDPTEFEFDDNEGDPRDLRAKYPNGRYRYFIRTLNDGYRTNVSLMLTGAYPTVPRILNYNALQSASGTGYVLVSWAPLAGGTAADSIQLRIEALNGGRAFETRDFGEPGALDGRATNVVIEPGDLRPNSTYIAWLEFRKTSHLNTNAYPGATGWAYLHRRTEFRIRTSTNAVTDIESYQLTKGHLFVQTDATSVTPDGTNAYQFSATVEGQNATSILSATLSLPLAAASSTSPLQDTAANAATAVISLESAPAEQEFAFQVSSPTPIDSIYPEGAYTFNVQTRHEGARTLPLTLAPASYPPPPRLANFDPSTPIPIDDIGKPLLLRWDAWPGGRASDFIQLRIQNHGTNVIETGDFGDNDALNGFATAALIPSNTFVRGETYSARLTFQRFTDLTITDGSLGAASYFSRTKFDIASVQDVDSYELGKGRLYVQTNTLPPQPDGTNAFRFTAELQVQATNSVTSASIILPSDGPTLPLSQNNSGDFSLEENSALPLDSLFPDGTYTFLAQTLHEGLRSMPLTLSPPPLSLNPALALAPAPDLPPPPYFLHDPSQRVTNDRPVTITWAPWTDATPNDFIQLQIRDSGTNLFETPDFGDDGALTGLATNAIIPAGLLARAEGYTLRLTFRRNVQTNTTSYPGATGISFYFARTDSDLRTVRPDVEEYQIEKGASFLQTSPTQVLPEPGEEFLFNAQVQASSPGLLTNATLIIPGDLLLPMLPDTANEQFEHSDIARTAEEFESIYPPGNYRFIVTTRNDGTQSLALTLAEPAYPPAPRLRNFTFGFNNPIPAGPLNLQWDPWAGGASNDFVQVQIRDAGTNVFETPDFGDEGALTGLATNAIIPAGVLRPGKGYGARIFFRRFVTIQETVPGTVGTLSFFSRTKFDIATIEPDARGYTIFKGREFAQTSTNTPAPLEYVFEATVTAAPTGDTLAWVTITPPAPLSFGEASSTSPLAPAPALAPTPRIDLSPDEDSVMFSYRQSFATQAELDANFPDGPYILEMLGAYYGQVAVTFQLTNSIPNPPHMQNYAQAGRIVASQNFSLSWDPFIGGRPQDFINVILAPRTFGPGFTSPPPDDDAALNGLDTSVLIRGGTLLANAIYQASVTFERLLVNDDTTLVEVPGRVGYYSRTSFLALTTGGGNPPLISSRLFELLPGNQIQFVMGTVPAASYVIEGSTNLVNWRPLTTFTATGQFSTNTTTQPGPAFFIRASLLR